MNSCLEIIKTIFEIIGSIGTLIVAIIALFQPYFLNKKKIKINISESKNGWFFEEKEYYKCNKCLKFNIVNTGNRKICIKKVMIKNFNKTPILLSQYENTVDIDIDEENSLLIDFIKIKEVIDKNLNKKYKNNKIVFYFYDNSNQIFSIKTKISYSCFLNLSNEDLIIKENKEKIKTILLNEEE